MISSSLIPRNISVISNWAHGSLLFGAIAGVFLAGGAPAGAAGSFLVLAGLAFLLFPPTISVEMKFWALFVGFLFFAALALVPVTWISIPPWRHGLQSLPITMSQQVSPVPRETIFYWAWLALSGAILLFALSHPIRSHILLILATVGTVTCLVYAGMAIYSQKSGWTYPYSSGATFGFFPNRNHAATFLVTGCLLALGVIGVAGKMGKWLLGGLAACGLAVCTTALLLFSSSRGGVVFLVIGTLIWLAGLGKARWSRPLVVSFVSIFVAGVVFFSVSGSEARDRIYRSIYEPVAGDGFAKTKGSSADKEITLDGRILIFRDTLRIIRDHPITGVGLGGFKYIYPFYQQDSLTESTSIHPESDWLMFAAEAGIPALLLLAAALILLLMGVFKQSDHPYWPLRWGVLCAGLTAILHGCVDVPAHRAPLGWWILVVMGAALQTSGTHRPPRFWQRAVFWMAGLGAIAMGVFLIRAEWFNGPPAPPQAAEKSAQKIFELYQEKNPDAAIQVATEALTTSPMAGNLYYQKGVLLLLSAETDSEVDALFAAERALNPGWPQIPLQQGRAWIGIDTTRTANLWEDSLERMRKVDLARGTSRQGTLSLWANLINESQKFPDLQKQLLMAHEDDALMALLWMEVSEKSLVLQELARLSQDKRWANRFIGSDRQRLLKTWYEKGDQAALFTFLEGNFDWKKDGWTIFLRRSVDAGDYQNAIAEVIKTYRLEFSLPSAKTPKQIAHSDPDADPLVRFDFFWISGNEVTARRILEEARTDAEKKGKRSPDVWKKSFEVASHDQQWELAWRYLRKYLTETGRELAF